MTKSNEAQMHEEVIKFHTDLVNLRAENVALHAHIQALERELSEARAAVEALEHAHRAVLHQNGWYARAYAAILAPYRIAAQTMSDGLHQAMENAAKAGMAETIEETEERVTNASKLRPAPDNPPREYVPPKHQETNGHGPGNGA